MVVGLVVVAVKEHQVARGEQGVEHNLVGGRRAVENEVRLVGVVNAGSFLLGGARRTFVNQKVTHAHVGVAEVGAENVFTKELREFAAGGVTAGEGTALMARAVKLGITLFDILFKAAEERRQDAVFILLGGSVNLTAVQTGVGGLVVDDGDNFLEEFGRERFHVVLDDHGNAEGGLLHLLKLAVNGLGCGHHNSGDFSQIRTIKIHNFARAAECTTGTRRSGDIEFSHWFYLI